MLLLRLPGELLLRFADRTFLALLFQLPPRFTRFEPDLAVTPVTMLARRGADALGGNRCDSPAVEASPYARLSRVAVDGEPDF